MTYGNESKTCMYLAHGKCKYHFSRFDYIFENSVVCYWGKKKNFPIRYSFELSDHITTILDLKKKKSMTAKRNLMKSSKFKDIPKGRVFFFCSYPTTKFSIILSQMTSVYAEH